MLTQRSLPVNKYIKYPTYKDSGTPWLGNIPSHWTSIKFKQAFIDKKKVTNHELNCGSISFGNVVYKDNEKIPEETRASYQEVLEGEFLINPLNLNFDLKSLRTALSTLNVVVSTGYIVLQSKPNINKNYLRWLLFQFDVAHMKTLGAGVRQTVNFTDIGNSYFQIPPLQEQQTIANYLNKATAKIDTLIEKQTKLIELLKEKRQAVISHAVTKGLDSNLKMKDSGVEWLGKVPEHWGVTRAKFVSKIFIPQRNKPELNDTTGTYWLTMDNMKTSHITSTKYYVSDSESKQAGSKVLISGSVIASCVGNFGIVAINKVDVIINQQLQAYMPFNIDNNYLRLLISSSKSYFEIVGTATTLIFVNREGFENLPVCLPPINEQTKIASYIGIYTTKIDTLIEKSNQAITLLKERRTALISAAVTGKIDVRGEVA